MSQNNYDDEYFVLDEGFLDKPTFNLIKNWKMSNEANRIKKFKSSSVTPEEASELKEEISIMRTEDIDYSTYKKAFHKFCTFIHTIDKGVILKTIKLDKNKNDENYTLYVEYADNTKKIKLPDDCKLYHISKVGGIRKLLPFFKGKSAKGYLYDKPRIYLTIRKKMPKFLADYKVNEKMYTYECKKDIKEVYVDPLVPSYIQGAVYIETQNPVDVEEVGMKAGTNDEEKVEAKNEAYEESLYDDVEFFDEAGGFDFDSFFESVMEFGLVPVTEDDEFIDDTEDILEDDDEEDEDDDEGLDVEDILPKSGMPSPEDVVQESKKFLGYGGTKKIEKKYNIPDEYCIQRRDIMYAKTKDNAAKKVDKAIGYIKDNEDLNKYFTPLLKSLFFNMMIFKQADLNKYPNVKKVYNAYKKSYKGNNPIDLNKIYTNAAAKFNAVAVPVAAAGAAIGGATVAAMHHEAFEESRNSVLLEYKGRYPRTYEEQEYDFMDKNAAAMIKSDDIAVDKKSLNTIIDTMINLFKDKFEKYNLKAILMDVYSYYWALNTRSYIDDFDLEFTYYREENVFGIDADICDENESQFKKICDKLYSVIAKEYKKLPDDKKYREAAIFLIKEGDNFKTDILMIPKYTDKDLDDWIRTLYCDTSHKRGEKNNSGFDKKLMIAVDKATETSIVNQIKDMFKKYFDNNKIKAFIVEILIEKCSDGIYKVMAPFEVMDYERMINSGNIAFKADAQFQVMQVNIISLIAEAYKKLSEDKRYNRARIAIYREGKDIKTDIMVRDPKIEFNYDDIDKRVKDDAKVSRRIEL